VYNSAYCKGGNLNVFRNNLLRVTSIQQDVVFLTNKYDDDDNDDDDDDDECLRHRRLCRDI